MTEIVEKSCKGGKTTMDWANDILNGLKEFAVFATVLVGGWAALIKLPKWIMKRVRLRKEKKDYVFTMLKKLCQGQNDLYDRLAAMDAARNKARIDDADVRSMQYLSHIAVMGAIMKLSKTMGEEINGEVKRYYEMNVDNLRRGVGMAPLHAAETREEKLEAKHIAIDLNDQHIADEKKEG